MCCTKWSKADKWVTINSRHLAITSHLQLWSFLPSTFVGPRSIILQVVLSLSYQESLNFPGLTINGDKLHTPKTSAILIFFPIPNSGNGCNTGCLFGYPKSFSDLLWRFALPCSMYDAFFFKLRWENRQLDGYIWDDYWYCSLWRRFRIVLSATTEHHWYHWSYSCVWGEFV